MPCAVAPDFAPPLPPRIGGRAAPVEDRGALLVRTSVLRPDCCVFAIVADA